MDLHEIDTTMVDLTPHQMKIIQAVYEGGGLWLTRSKVARALGKRRLTPYDIDCLKLLTDRGIIETSTQPTSAPGSEFAYIYHMPDEVAEALVQWSEMRDQQAEEQRRRPIRLFDN